MADALESEGDELSTSVTMSKLIAVAPRAKAFLSALFVEAHCTIAITSETHASDWGRLHYLREAAPSFEQAIKLSQTENAKMKPVNTVTPFQKVYINGTRSTRCLNSDKKPNFMEKIVPQVRARYAQLIFWNKVIRSMISASSIPSPRMAVGSKLNSPTKKMGGVP